MSASSGWQSSPFLVNAPKLGIGWTISTTFAVVRRNLGALLLLGLLFAGLPNALFDWFDLPGVLNGWLGTRNAAIGTFLAMLPAAALQALLTAGATLVVAADLGGQRVGLGAALPALARVALPVMALNVLALLGVAAGGILLVVPGLILSVTWLAALPVRVMEGPGIRHAFGRSAALVQGNFWRCAALVLVYATVLVLAGLLAFVAGIELGRGPAGILADAVWWTVAGTLQSVGCAVAYVGLRRIKEGDDPARLSAVFA